MLGSVYRSAVVTGGSGGIGAAIVRKLAGQGVAVLAVSPERDKLHQLAGETGAEALCLDIADAAAVGAAFADREIDILVNCAGVLGPLSKVHETPPDVMDALAGVNLAGIVNCLRAVTPGMIARDRGHIVNFGSVAGRYPISGEPVYAATKAAVHLLTLNLRLDLHGTAIRVSEILPGRVESGMHAEMVGGDRARARADFYDGYQCLQPADIADAVHYVLSAPGHVDITQLEIMPTHQVMGGASFLRDA